MPFRDILKKKDKIKDEGATGGPTNTLAPDVPQFSFLRTTTTTQESIEPPSFPGDPVREKTPFLSPDQPSRGITGRFRRHSNAATTTPPAANNGNPKHEHHRLSRMNFGRNRALSSSYVPENLPEITGDGVARNEEEEAKWEKRATMLVTANSPLTSTPSTPGIEITGGAFDVAGGQQQQRRSRSPSVNNPPDDTNIQEAIRLHENGDLEASTKMFGDLADPNTHNNALSQVLYGLALRHGWGCEPNQEQAVRYLSMAASNSAEVEKLALGAGMKKGGAAKGELVLAIFELANCFRHGWGIKKDPAAAKQYYETAANLGDTDAMNEVAWCYLEGFGTKKDKFKAAQFLRLAESKGSKTLGNTWYVPFLLDQSSLCSFPHVVSHIFMYCFFSPLGPPPIASHPQVV
ncbi:HCP-like protein [Periconia macrospinosa]|uniref:HCP-like protein n=1 Tax=Periconia macrospinosa TaxID=97972 RepID=A0A2V1DJ41_9PLEO|nr:HCP-like protein [Periconia macrospinosa]